MQLPIKAVEVNNCINPLYIKVVHCKVKVSKKMFMAQVMESSLSLPFLLFVFPRFLLQRLEGYGDNFESEEVPAMFEVNTIWG